MSARSSNRQNKASKMECNENTHVINKHINLFYFHYNLYLCLFHSLLPLALYLFPFSCLLSFVVANRTFSLHCTFSRFSPRSVREPTNLFHFPYFCFCFSLLSPFLFRVLDFSRRATLPLLVSVSSFCFACAAPVCERN